MQHRHIGMLGIPMDLGAGRRGTDMGPSALRLAQLGPALRSLGHELTDLGNIEVPQADSGSARGHGSDSARYAASILEACSRAYETLCSLDPDTLPLGLGGDHSVAMATVAAAFRGPAACEAVVWIDAHADLNTPASSPSGNVHGMPMAQLLGLAGLDSQGTDVLAAESVWGGGPVLSARQLVYVGLRSVDPYERQQIEELGIRAYSMSDIDRLGIARVFEETAGYLHDYARWHVSLDADALDPLLAPGVGTPVEGGLTYREAHLFMESLAASGRVASVDLVEVNPILDTRNRTAGVVTGLASSLFGKRIL